MFYVASVFCPDKIGIKNFKKKYGFTQGRGKMGADHIKAKLAEVDKNNEKKKEN